MSRETCVSDESLVGHAVSRQISCVITTQVNLDAVAMLGEHAFRKQIVGNGTRDLLTNRIVERELLHYRTSHETFC